MMGKKEKMRRLTTEENKDVPTNIAKVRKHWRKKGYELINITPLCEVKIGVSGWCNDFNEPDEEIYHIQMIYRGEVVANFSGKSCDVIDDSKYFIYIEGDTYDSDFIVFRLVTLGDER